MGRLYEAAKEIAPRDLTSPPIPATPASSSTTWLAGATPSRPPRMRDVTINLLVTRTSKTFTDFWQKMIDEDLIDTKTVGWTDDWNKGLMTAPSHPC